MDQLVNKITFVGELKNVQNPKEGDIAVNNSRTYVYQNMTWQELSEEFDHLMNDWGWDIATHDLKLLSVQVIEMKSIKTGYLWKYEGIIFNCPTSLPTHIKVRIFNKTLSVSNSIDAELIKVEDSYVQFITSEYIEPEIYDFELMY